MALSAVMMVCERKKGEWNLAEDDFAKFAKSTALRIRAMKRDVEQDDGPNDRSLRIKIADVNIHQRTSTVTR